MTQNQAFLVTFAISALSLVGDYFLKRASQSVQPFYSFEFLVGLVIFASTAAGWVVVLRVIKLGVVGVIYGVSTVLFMALLGRLAFGESLRPQEVLGLCLGIASIMLLARFS